MSTNSEQVSHITRLTNSLKKVKTELAVGAKLGTMSLLTISGGVIAGWCYAKLPYVPNTTFPLAGALGSGLMLGALAGIFEQYSEQAANVGTGLLTVSLAKEAEKYFSS